ncbi:uncharacterized protein BXZ73DRAFT_100175 [Epithele typhae]|uniref:uncharacterized protein n=1 Tax=Epithele typhae TaxID=378194 RepID=UPI002008A5DC|nr:uncharacterized protein BXZ73DRAFT_100175 [Epithele typhae]KAH9936753.1 hypothetical protein BXZ73DRAFT_100175 [Epithele typhae]
MSGHARQSFRANPLTPFSGIPGVVKNLRSRVDISVAHELERIKNSSFRLTDNEIAQMDAVPPDVPRSASARKWVNDNIERIVDMIHRLGPAILELVVATQPYAPTERLADTLPISTGLHQADVLGGGLLGLEAATAGHRSHYSLSRQLDTQGGDIVRRRIEGMRVRFLGGTFAVRVYTSPRNPTRWARVIGVEVADGTTESCDLIVFVIGITPRDDVARAAGLADRFLGLDARVALQDGLIAAVGSLPALRVLVVGILCYHVADPPGPKCMEFEPYADRMGNPRHQGMEAVG